MHNRFRLFFLVMMATPVIAAASTVTGVMAEGEFTDDARIFVRASNGKVIEAYCDMAHHSPCKDEWFFADNDDVRHLKKSMIGKKVTLRYEAEKAGDRLEGPSPDDVFNFVKDLRFSK